MTSHRFLCLLLLLSPVYAEAAPKTHRVPADFPSVQAALAAAAAGDTVRVAPGTYRENVTITKAVTITSDFTDTRDVAIIRATILDGGGSAKKEGAQPIINVPAGVHGARIVGLTLRNGAHGLMNAGRIDVFDNYFSENGDALSFESGAGHVRGNLFEKNRDDGIDMDDASEALIEDNVIRDNRDDGIEIRLHKIKDPAARLTIIIRRNLITGNGEDGLQLIDYPGKSARSFLIEGNVFHRNAMVGLACMSDGNTKENYEGAGLLEPVVVINNTFAGGQAAITGGDNLLLLNNIITGYARAALKRVHGDSDAGPNLLWKNGADLEECDLNTTDFITADPMLDTGYSPAPGSPARGGGAAVFDFHGDEITVDRASFTSPAPDLGARLPLSGSVRRW